MKEKIVDAAARQIIQYGLKKFTVEEIASELKISKKTIYQYFGSKDDIIREYFREAVESDKESMTAALSGSGNFSEKLHAIVYSNHKYRLPVALLNEAKQFYPEEWEKIEELKQFKLKATQNLLRQGAEEGIFQPDIHFGVLSTMLERISDLFTDYDFLVENRLTAREAMDEALKIICNGILEAKDRKV